MSSNEFVAIGPYRLANRAFLAPMAGITDLPFRRIAARFGAGLVVSEMIASEWLAEGDPAAQMRIEGEGVGLHVVQLAGCEARWLAEGARIAGKRRRPHYRHQHGLPGEARDRRRSGLGTLAQSRSRPALDRSGRRRGERSGHAQDAAGLGCPVDRGAGSSRGARKRRASPSSAFTAARARSFTTDARIGTRSRT